MRTMLLSLVLLVSGCSAVSHPCEAPEELAAYDYSSMMLGGTCGELLAEDFVPYNPENCVFHWAPASSGASCDFDIARDCQSVKLVDGRELRIATVTGALSSGDGGTRWEGTLHVEGRFVGTDEPCSGDYDVAVLTP